VSDLERIPADRSIVKTFDIQAVHTKLFVIKKRVFKRYIWFPDLTLEMKKY